MVEIETQPGGIVYIVWFWVGWMFWRFPLNLKGQCTKHREFPPPCCFCPHDQIMSAASINCRKPCYILGTQCATTLCEKRDPAWGLVPTWNCLSRFSLSPQIFVMCSSARTWKKGSSIADTAFWENFGIKSMSNKYMYACYGIRWVLKHNFSRLVGFWCKANGSLCAAAGRGGCIQARQMAVAAGEYWSEDNQCLSPRSTSWHRHAKKVK